MIRALHALHRLHPAQASTLGPLVLLAAAAPVFVRAPSPPAPAGPFLGEAARRGIIRDTNPRLGELERALLAADGASAAVGVGTHAAHGNSHHCGITG